MCKFPIFLPFIISFVYHYVQVLLLFTIHYIFSVPLCASSPSFYIPLYLQCPIMGKFPIYLHFIRSSVSHSGQVPNNFVLHYIFSVPLCACSLSFYLSLYLQFPIMCKFPNLLCFVISSVSHSGQVPYSFTFHYIFSVPLCASSPYFYISFYIQCPILCKFPNFLCFVISSVSHSGQVPNNFVLHYIFSVPLCASSLSFYLSLFPLCTIMCKFSFFLPFIICSVSHYVQVLHLFTFHYIFSVPLWASSLSIYFYLQCPILGKYPIILCFIIYLVSHYVQVPYLFTFHYFLCVPLCASSPSFFPLYLQCPILGKFPIYLHSIRSSVSPFGQVPYLFTFHYIFSVPFGASSLSIYIPLDLQCPIWGKFPIYLHFIISLVSHLGQVPYLFTFHQIFSVPLCASLPTFLFSVPLCASSLTSYVSFSVPLCASTHSFTFPLVSHFGQVPYLFTFHYIFSVPFGQVPYLFTFHYIFSVPFLCASSPF